MFEGYEELGLELTCKALPKACMDCPFIHFVKVDVISHRDLYYCGIMDKYKTAPDIVVGSHRIKGCPLSKVKVKQKKKETKDEHV